MVLLGAFKPIQKRIFLQVLVSSMQLVTTLFSDSILLKLVGDTNGRQSVLNNNFRTRTNQ